MSVITDGLFKMIIPHTRASPFVLADHHLLSSNVAETDYPAYNPATAYTTIGDRVIITAPSNTITVTIANPAVVTWAGHSLPVKTAVVITTTGALPTGLVAGKVYYTRDITANTFKLSNTPGGDPIATTGAQSGVHTLTATIHSIYQVLAVTVAGEHPSLYPNKWIRVGATNRWRLFDGSTSSKTSQADSINFTVRTTSRADGLALLGVSAETIQVIVTDTVDGIVYDSTVSGIEPPGITPSSWFFSPVESKTELDFTDIPTFYSNTDIQVILTHTGDTVRCGVCVIGKIYSPGFTQGGFSIGIEDYSLKDTDTFGNYEIVERGFSRNLNLNVLLNNIELNRLQRTLSEYRASPVLYIGTSLHGATLLFGYYEEFKTLARYKTYSMLSIELRGIT